MAWWCEVMQQAPRDVVRRPDDAGRLGGRPYPGDHETRDLRCRAREITASLPSVRGRRTHPLRRAAPGRLVATPGWLLLATAAVALLTAALVAPGLFARAADDAALDAGLAAVDEDAFASTSVDVRATWIGVLPDVSEQVVRRALTRLPTYGRPVVTAQGTAANRLTTPIVEVRGREAQPSVLYYRDGAVEALGGTAGTTGVWLAAEVAEALGVGPGDQVRFGLEKFIAPGEGKRAAATVAGTFERSRGSALPQQLADDPRIARRDLPWDPDRPGVGRPHRHRRPRDVRPLALAIGEQPLWTADLELPRRRHARPRRRQRPGRCSDSASGRSTRSSRVASATLSAEPAPTRLQVSPACPTWSSMRAPRPTPPRRRRTLRDRRRSSSARPSSPPRSSCSAAAGSGSSTWSPASGCGPPRSAWLAGLEIAAAGASWALLGGASPRGWWSPRPARRATWPAAEPGRRAEPPWPGLRRSCWWRPCGAGVDRSGHGPARPVLPARPAAPPGPLGGGRLVGSTVTVRGRRDDDRRRGPAASPLAVAVPPAPGDGGRALVLRGLQAVTDRRAGRSARP